MVQLTEWPAARSFPPAWSHSAWRNYSTCQRLYYWQVVLGLRPNKYQRALEFGSMGHKLLENFYRAMQSETLNQLSLGPELLAIRDLRGADNFDAENLQTFETDLYALEGMVKAYWDFYTELDNNQWKVLYVEEHFKDESGMFAIPPHGYPDLVVTQRNSKKVWIIDHKFLKSPTKGMIRKLPLDTQVQMYYRLLHLYLKDSGMEIGGVIYNIIKKSSRRLKLKQSLEEYQQELHDEYVKHPDKYFFRESVRITPEQIGAFEQDLSQVQTQLVNSFAKNAFPKNTNHCDNYGECAYMELCLRGKEGLTGFTTKEHKEK